MVVAGSPVVSGVELKDNRWLDVGVDVLPVDSVLEAQLVVVHEKDLARQDFWKRLGGKWGIYY